MTEFANFLNAINDPGQRQRTEDVLQFVNDTFPQLERRIAWNQPMFTDHGTFIIAFSVARQHLAVAPETVALDHFDERIKQAGFKRTKMLLQMPWNKPIDYALLKDIISYNIQDKKDCASFWRKPQ